MVDNIIYELRVICRSGCEQKYPFTVYTQSRYLFSTFADAEAAVQRLVQENSAKEWISVYRYEIYTFELGKEIQTDYDTRDALDTTIYLPDGTRWISKGEKGVVEVGKIYEHLMPLTSGGKHVDLCIVENESKDDYTSENEVKFFNNLK